MKPPRLTPAQILWAALLGAVALGLVWLIWPRAVVVQTASVDRGDVRREVEEEGRVEVRNLFVVAAPISGFLQRVDLRPGDKVSRGDTVATILPSEPTLLDSRAAKEAGAAVTAAKSALAIARTDLEHAKGEEQRTTTLFDRGFASKAALDRVRTGSAAAAAMVDQRHAELERAQAAIGRPKARTGKITVRSPASGKVLRVLQESETVTAAGAPLLEIGNPADIEVVAEFLSQDAAAMREGACGFVASSEGNYVRAQVRTVEPYAKTKVSALGVEEQRVRVVLLLHGVEAAETRMGHGYRADVRVVMFEEKDALRVPTDALVRRGDGWAVFQLIDGRARLTPVSIGDGDDQFRTVRNGLAEGDKIVLFPSETLKDGERARAAK